MQSDKNKKGFRNNLAKCPYNYSGYCKFKEECRKSHSSSICKKEKCDKKCPERHPKDCTFKEECRFLEKDSCAFNHDTQSLDKRIKDYEKVLAVQKAENEIKIKSLGDELERVKKEAAANIAKIQKENSVLLDSLAKE